MITTFCYQSYCVEKMYLVLIIIPIFFALLFVLYRDFVTMKNKEEQERFRKRSKWIRLFMLFTRTLMFLLLLIAIAQPFTTQKVTTHGNDVVKLLVDNTDSMNVYDPDLLSKVKDKFGSIPVELNQISSGKTSALGDGILKNIQAHDNLVILSDGNNNEGKALQDVGLYARVADTKLFAFDISPIRNDAYVEIFGPGETISGTLNKFLVKVTFIGSQPAFTLQVSVDDRIVYTGQNAFTYELLESFSQGYHTITAKIILTDYFADNNVFYKSVKAVPKPRIFFVSERPSPLEEGLKQIYDFHKGPSLPPSLDGYQAIIFNDIPYSSLKPRIDDLTGFLLDGNGMLFIGGRNSYDKGGYKETLLEGLLPVKVGTGKIVSPLKNNVVIVLDVSESFGDFSFKIGGDATTLDLGKGLAIKMVEGFRDDLGVGLVAFASIAQIVSPVDDLSNNRELITQKLKTLGSGDGTSIDQGLLAADRALDQVKGTKNVILISDGKVRGRIGESPAILLVTQRLAKKGTRIYTVGIPSILKNEGDIDRAFMTKLATIGNGNYFEPSEFQFLNVFFGKPEEKDKIFNGSSNLAVIDKQHFITQDLGLNAQVNGVNFVIPKLGARSLVYTGDGIPVVNSWNFGLGRVVSLATDDGSMWAADLLSKENSLLFTRMINYAVGNPEKDKELAISASDTFLGEGTDVIVRSKKYPVSQQLTFTKQSEEVYKAEFYPDKTGYVKFFDAIVAVNPPREYYRLDLNQNLRDMVSLSGGKMLKLDENFQDEIKSSTAREELQRKDLKFYPLGAALGLFILELLIRKIHEHRKKVKT